MIKIKRKTYALIRVKNHPYFGTRLIGKHRFLIYEKYGENLPDCEICKKPVNWDICHIDHIDNNPLNNDIDNLRPLHRGCNTRRDYKHISNQVRRITEGTLSHAVDKAGFINILQAASYAMIRPADLRLLYQQDKKAFNLLIEEAKMKKDSDPNAKKLTAKQRYDRAMIESGHVRIQGWIRPEDKESVQSFFITKEGLDYEAGEHLIKKGEKRAKKCCK